MTGMPPAEFGLVFRREEATLTVLITGDLDYDTGDGLADAVATHLGSGQAPPREVRLDFTDLRFIDSSGLSALLMVHRRTSALGARLRLDNRPVYLQRMLDLTNVLDHLTATPAAGHGGPLSEDGDGLTEAGAT